VDGETPVLDNVAQIGGGSAGWQDLVADKEHDFGPGRWVGRLISLAAAWIQVGSVGGWSDGGMERGSDAAYELSVMSRTVVV
jgi:hypothetical protein